MSKSFKIRPINHGTVRADRNRYCGPAVISAITGICTGDAARRIRENTGRKMITGTHPREVIDVLNQYDITATRQTMGFSLNRSTGPTLAAWLKATVKDRTADRVFLIVSGWHWQLVQGRRYVCGLTSEIVSIKDKRVKRRARVADVYELTANWR